MNKSNFQFTRARSAIFNFQLRGINKNELVFIACVLVSIAIVSWINFQSAFIRSRDVQRKNDLKHIASALNNYLYDFGAYPPAIDGKIASCGDPKNPSVCKWGVDAVADLGDPNYPPYINPLPRDPQQGKGRYYLYISNTRNFQLFASLENPLDDEYNGRVAQKNILCGEKACNFGIVSSGRPEDTLPANEKK